MRFPRFFSNFFAFSKLLFVCFELSISSVLLMPLFILLCFFRKIFENISLIVNICSEKIRRVAFELILPKGSNLNLIGIFSLFFFVIILSLLKLDFNRFRMLDSRCIIFCISIVSERLSLAVGRISIGGVRMLKRLKRLGICAKLLKTIFMLLFAS